MEGFTRCCLWAVFACVAVVVITAHDEESALIPDHSSSGAVEAAWEENDPTKKADVVVKEPIAEPSRAVNKFLLVARPGDADTSAKPELQKLRLAKTYLMQQQSGSSSSSRRRSSSSSPRRRKGSSSDSRRRSSSSDSRRRSSSYDSRRRNQGSSYDSRRRGNSAHYQSSGGGACFPANAKVQSKQHGTTEISNIAVGDHVLTKDGYAEVARHQSSCIHARVLPQLVDDIS